MLNIDNLYSDEFFAYTGDKLIPQRSGYMLASTAALRIGPGAEPQPLHRVRSLSSKQPLGFRDMI
jgi:hypothetical protein